MTERVTVPAEVIRGARALIRRPMQALDAVRGAIGATGSIAGKGLSAPDSPLNVDIGPHRRFAWVRADLGDLRRIKDVYGGTVNDVVLDRRLRRARPAPALARPRHRRARAEGDGPGQHPHRRAARRPRQPGDGDDGAAPGLVRGPDRAPRARPPRDGQPEAVQAGGRREPARRDDRLRAADDRLAGRSPAVPAALLQPRRHQRPGPAVPALRARAPPPRHVPDGAARASARPSASGS